MSSRFVWTDCMCVSAAGRTRSFSESAYWYQAAVNMAQEDECGEFDATMDFPSYELKARVAELYMLGGFGLEKDPSYAGISCYGNCSDWFYFILFF